MPRLLQPAAHGCFRKCFHPFLSPIRQGAIPKIGEKFRGSRVEITFWHGRKCLSFSFQKSPDVPAIFFYQSLCTILRVTLEMYEQALLFLFHERIHSALG